MNSINQKSKRIAELDALRGLALFGILLVNIFVFHAPLCYYGEFYGVFTGKQAQIIELVVNFAGGKFLMIFSFLFGYGMFLQERSKQTSYTSYFSRRMIVLFIFGLLHILLFWLGDILASYALLGLLALPIRYWSSNQLLMLGIFFILFRPLYYLGAASLDWPIPVVGKPLEMNVFMSIFQEGSYKEIFWLRMKEFWAFLPENIVWYVPKTFGFILVGMYAARKNLVLLLSQNTNKILITSGLLLFSGTLWVLFKSDIFRLFNLDKMPLMRPLLIGLNVMFETAMGMAYIFGFLILFQKYQRISEVFARTGRLALTNYILQSFVCVLLFYGFGFGYYGKLLPSDLVLICIAIFGFNLTFSWIYLQFKKTGPLEFVWRKLIGS